MAAIGEHHIDDFWHSTRTIGAAVGPRQGGHHRATTVPSGSQKSQLNHQIGGDRAVVLAGEGGRDEGSAGTGVRPVMRLWNRMVLGVRTCVPLSGIMSRTRQTHRTPEPCPPG